MKRRLHQPYVPYVLLYTLLFLAIGAYGQCPGPGIASISFNVLAAPAPTITGTTQICPGGSTMLSVPGSFSSYNWGGAGSGSASSLMATAPGNYVVTVTNAAGCTGTASVAVTQLTGPAPNIVQATYQCNGQRTLNAGSGFSSYAWSAPGGSSATLTVSSPGLYTVTVTAANGCTGTDDINVTIPPPPTVNISTSGSFCQGSTAQLNATPGLSSYTWSAPGGSSATINVSNAGTYTVTATDAFGCTVTNTATVTTLPAPTPTISGTTSFCAGGNTILDAGAGFNAYTWSGGNGNSQSITVFNSGTYTVTVTAANGCTGTASQGVNVVAAPAPNIVAQPYACNGQFTLNAGTGFATYAWSGPGGSSASLTVNNSGLYTVTVTNALGCSGTDNINVNIPSPPSVSISGPGVFCQGSSVVLSATPGLSAYIWTGNSSGPNFTANSAGTYTVTATDAFGCTTTSSTTVSVLPAPSPVIVGTNTICSGSSTTFSVSTAFNAYQWSGGNGNNQSINIGNAGTYTVTVTAANTCTNTASRVLTVNASPSPNITEQPYLCDGQLVLTAGGNFNTYNWSNAQSSPSITVVNNSTYSVTVTNAAGCTGSDTYAVTIPIAPSVTISGNSLICPGASTVLSATVGYGSYQWSGSPVNSSTRTVNAAGLYAVTVTDAQGCTASNQFTVNALVAPSPNIAGPAAICPGSAATFTVPGIFSAYQWSNSINASSITVNTAGTYTVTVTAANGCTGTDTQTLTLSNTLQPQIVAQPYLCDGQFTLDAGAGFATYNWNNSAASQTNTVNTSGIYTVTVTETGGCTGTASFTVNIPTPPAASVSGGSTVCPGTAVNLVATPGFSNYAWSNGPLTANVNVTAPATYVVTVTDAVGCTTTATATVANFVAPVAGISGPTTICTNSTALYSASSGFNAYLWSTGNQSADITVNTANTYTVTVTDNNGCTASASQSLLVLDALQPQISPQPYACNGQITLEGSAGFTAYAWSNGETTAAATALQSGDYTLTVTGSGGCTGTANVSVTVPAVPQTSVNGSGTVCPGSTTTLSAGAGFVSYQWSNAELVSSIQVSNPTTYTVTVTDGNGCTATASAVVANFQQPMVSISGSAEICAGSTTTLSASNGFASYQWSNGPLTASITVDSVSNYMVTATDANGCTATANLTTVAVTALNPDIVVQPYQCTGTLTLDAGPGFSTYAWSGGGVATPSFSVSNSGSYTVTVTDATGCTGTATQAVVVPALPVAAVTGGGNVCPGETATLTATAGFVAYAWTGAGGSASFSTSVPATYTVTVTDVNGCTATADATVGNFPQPVVNISGNSLICPNNSTTLNASAGFAAYAWSNGQSSAAISVDTADVFVVTVTDANGCNATASLSTTIAPPLSPAIAVQPYQCTGTLTLDAGAGFSAYNWSGGGASGQTITVSNSGTYTVTVADASGCTSTALQTITVPVLPVVTISGGSTVCPGEPVTLSATSGFSNYQWSQTGNSVSITTTTPATYSVTVADGSGCTAIASAVVGNFPTPSVAIAGDNQFCAGSSTTLSATSGFSAYQWSGNQNTAGISVDSPGNYSVTVTDNNGCTATATRTVVVGSLPVPTIAVTSNYGGFATPCAEQALASAAASVSNGTAPFNFVWSGGGNTAAVSNLLPGPYTLTVTDALGCTGTATVSLTAAPPLAPELDIVPPTCETPGQVTVLLAQAPATATTITIDNGSPELLTNNFFTINNLEGGVYAIRLADSFGCTTELDAEVPAGELLQTQVGDTLEVLRGVPVNLSVTLPFTPVSISWTSATPVNLSCADCLNPRVVVDATTTLVFDAATAGGCIATGQFLLQTKKQSSIFAPNVIAPGSAGNDRFTIFGDAFLSNIQVLEIFDRWGNQMAAFQNIAPNDPNIGWDGRYRNQDVTPGVYVWWARLSYADGTSEIMEGEVAVVR